MLPQVEIQCEKIRLQRKKGHLPKGDVPVGLAMSEISTRRSGLLFGSFIAESLSLGVHWIYDVDELVARHGRVTEFQAPASDAYHPHKQAGDQGHVGDQALCLMRCLKAAGEWDAFTYLEAWQAMWSNYDDYVDKATKTTLGNLSGGAYPAICAASSDELAGPARVAPLLAFLGEEDEATIVEAAVEQTVLTHRSVDTIEAAEFLAKTGYRLMHGGKLEACLRELTPSWALQAAEKVGHLPAAAAIGQLGRSCSIAASLPSVVYLALKYADDVELAFVENAMAGGDNCARGLALGMLLGGAKGVNELPERWRKGICHGAEFESFLASLG